MWGPSQNLGPINSVVLTFIGHKQTDMQFIYFIYKGCTLKRFSLTFCILEHSIFTINPWEFIWDCDPALKIAAKLYCKMKCLFRLYLVTIYVKCCKTKYVYENQNFFFLYKKVISSLHEKGEGWGCRPRGKCSGARMYYCPLPLKKNILKTWFDKN